MEIDQLKSAAQDQMGIMMMMDKLPDFYTSYNDVVSPDLAPPPHDFAAGATTTTTSNDIPHFINNPHIGSSHSFITIPSNTILFQDESLSPPAPAFPSTPTWRGGEFPAAAADADACSTPIQKKNSMAAMREMIFRIAAMQPIHIDPESLKPPKRRNVKTSKDPQSVAARHRRERISERIRILQRLVPGGTKMDTASMLDEAIHYVKFLKTQVQSLERAQASWRPTSSAGIGFPVAMSSGSNLNPMGKTYYQQQQNVEHYGDAQ